MVVHKGGFFLVININNNNELSTSGFFLFSTCLQPTFSILMGKPFTHTTLS